MNMKPFGSAENINEFSYVNWAHKQSAEGEAGNNWIFLCNYKKNGNL